MATHSNILAWRILMDRGPWWATVHGVSKSQTRLKRLSSSSSVLFGLPSSSAGEESTCSNAGYSVSVPGLGRSLGEGTGYPLQSSWASLMAQLVKNPLQCRRPWF